MREHRVQMTFEGSQPIEIGCREDEDIITAGLRQGVLLISECREGSCGACRGFLEEGKYDTLLEHSAHALSEYEEDEGWILACRLKPRSDLHIDFDYHIDRVARFESTRRSGRITVLERLSSSVIRVVVRTLAAQPPLHWEAGQHVRLNLVQADIARSYSLANLPNNRRELEFFIQLVPDGRFSEALTNMHGDGAAVLVEGPFGQLTLQPECQEPVFIAGGTGLAPILSMLRKFAVEAPDSRPTLIFGVTREEDLFAQQEIRHIATICPGLTSHVTVAKPGSTWAGASGTAVDVLAQQFPKMKNGQTSHYYLCGPAAMMHAARAVAERFGVPANAIHQELFVTTEGKS